MEIIGVQFEKESLLIIQENQKSQSDEESEDEKNQKTDQKADSSSSSSSSSISSEELIKSFEEKYQVDSLSLIEQQSE